MYTQMQHKEFGMKEKLVNKAKGIQSVNNVEDGSIKNLRIELIRNKLKLGRDISHEELEFLKEHSPATYSKAMEVLREREEFRRELRNYRTKGQVDKTYELRMSGYITVMKSAGEDDAEIIQMKASAIRDEYNKFRMSDEYKKLEEEWKK